MKHRGMWLVGGALAAVVLYELFFASGHVPAGYQTIRVSPGARFTPTAPTSGAVALVLPSGARWSGAGRQDGLATASIPLPSGASSPLLVTGVNPGTSILVQYVDASGNTQATGYVFG